MFLPGIVLISGLLLALLPNSTVDAEAATGNTTCADTTFDVYTQEAGETPCKTYEKLRQICNPDYVVPTFPTTIPPDLCDDQNSSCCCNSVAWYMSMLCMNCQLGTNELQGFDAVGNGYYQKYLQGRRQSESCSPQFNGSLPVDIQKEVCKRQVKIPDYMYPFRWDSTGDWYWHYLYYWQHLVTVSVNIGATAFTVCDVASITSSSVVASESSSTPVTTTVTVTVPVSPSGSISVSDSSPLTTGAAVGITFGSTTAGLAVILVLVFIIMRLVQKRHEGDGIHQTQEVVEPYVIKVDPGINVNSLTPLRPRGVGKFRGEGELSMFQAQANPQTSGSNETNQKSL